MKVEVWTTRDLSRQVEAKCIWKGDLPAIPRVGEFVCLNSDWCSETVKAVHYDLQGATVTLEIGPDYQNEYPEWPDGDAA